MLPLSNNILGCSAALASAMTFAFCTILLQKLSTSLSPAGANFWKCLLGSLLLSIPLFFLGFDTLTLRLTFFLFLSGLFGIALADTCFFKALVLLGPRLTLLLETLGPIFTVILAVIFLKEKLSPEKLTGIGCILTGVIWVIWEQVPRKISDTKWKRGILYALCFALCISVSIILTKISVVTISALEATLLRLLSAFVLLFFYGLVSKKIPHWVTPIKDPQIIKIGSAALLLGIFGGFWLSTVALKLIDASIATVLNATAPLFILPMVALLKKEKISLRSILGTLLAICGIAFIFLY